MKNNIFILVGSLLLLISCTRENTDEFDHFFFRNADADLSVEINGNIASKTFILYLHGGPGGGSFAYNSGYFADQMEKDYAMVYMDQRGNGASQGGYQKEALTIAQNSEDIYQLVQLLKARYGSDITLFIAGHSWGGLTSAHALINTDLQQDVKGWIEMNGAHDFVKNDIEAVKMFQRFATEEIAKQNNLDFWEEVLDRVNQIDTLNITDEDQGYLNFTGFEAEAKFDLTDDNEGSLLPYTLGAPGLSLASAASNNLGNPILNEDSYKNPLTPRLNEIEIPCLFLWGKYDFVVPPALGVSAYNLVNTDKKKIVIFETSGHSPMVNEGVAFTQEVKDFIEQYK